MPATRLPVVELLAADDRSGMDGWLALRTEALAHDLPGIPPPCPVEHAHELEWEGREVRAWAVRDDGRTVAVAVLALPLCDNLRAAGADVLVAPDRRRRGLGRLLLDHLVTQARSAGRHHLWVEVHSPLHGTAPGTAFVRAAGARPALADTRRVLDLDRDDATRRRLAAQAREAARGYDLVQWTGATPERWRDDLAALIARMSTDPPQGELSLEPERWDAARVQERDALRAVRGDRTVVTAARAPEGHLVGFTEIIVAATAHGHARQGDTIVLPAHRGHRLGLCTKLANLERLAAERPDVRRVFTYNADDNRPMVAVNEAMGFRPQYRLVEWELDLRSDP